MRAKTFASFCVSGVSSSEVLCAVYNARVFTRCFITGKDYRWGILACRLSRRAASATAAPAEAAAGATAAATATGARASPLLSANLSAETHSRAARRATDWTGTARGAAAARRANVTVVARPETASQRAGAAYGGMSNAAAAGPRTVAKAGQAAVAAPTAPAAATPAVKSADVATVTRKAAAGQAERLTAAAKIQFRFPLSSAATVASATARVSRTATPTAIFPSTLTTAQGILQKPDSANRLCHRDRFSCPFAARQRFQTKIFSLSCPATDLSAAYSNSLASVEDGPVLLRRLDAGSNGPCVFKPRFLDLYRRSFFTHAPFAYHFGRVAAVAGGSTCSGGPAYTKEDKCRAPLLSAVSLSFLLLPHGHRIFLATHGRAGASPAALYRLNLCTSEISAGGNAAAFLPLRYSTPSIGNFSTCRSTRFLGSSDAAVPPVDATETAAAGDRVATAGGRTATAVSVTRACTNTSVSTPVIRGSACPLCVNNKHWRRSCFFARAARQSRGRRGSSSSFASKTPTPRFALLGVWPFLIFFCCVSLLLPGVANVSFFGLDKPFSGAFIFSVLGVYGLWSVGEATDSAALKNFLTRNFLLSIENLRQKRFHTIFTASLTHASPGHLLANVFIIGQLCRLLSHQLWPSEFFSLFCLSSCMGAAGHFLTSRRPVVGASAFAYALLWTEAIKNSRELFRILPFPFLPVTALQFCHIAVVFECCMALLSRRYNSKFPWRLQQLLRSVSWSGHLGGLAAGCTYSWYKRTVEGDVLRWPSFLQLNRRYALSDWTFTVHDLRDSFKILRLECKLLTSSSELEKTVVLRVLEKLRAQKEFRRMAVAHGALLR